MGSAKNKRMALGRVQRGEIALENPAFWNFFVQVLTIPIPPKESKMRGWRRMAWGR